MNKFLKQRWAIALMAIVATALVIVYVIPKLRKKTITPANDVIAPAPAKAPVPTTKTLAGPVSYNPN